MAHRFDGDSFEAAIIAAGYDEDELAVDAGCSKSLIKLYKYGYRTPPPPRLITLSALLGCSVEDFFTETEEVSA
jgi:transcriptional regulator with XRE-family HTH domain